MEQTEERAVCCSGKGAELYGVLFRVKDDLEGGEAAEMGLPG